MKSALHKFTTGFAGVTEDAVLDAVAASGAAGADDAERLGNKGFFDAASSSFVIFLVPRKVQSTTVAEELPFSSALLSVSTVPLQQVLRTPGRVVP